MTDLYFLRKCTNGLPVRTSYFRGRNEVIHRFFLNHRKERGQILPLCAYYPASLHHFPYVDHFRYALQPPRNSTRWQGMLGFAFAQGLLYGGDHTGPFRHEIHTGNSTDYTLNNVTVIYARRSDR